MNWLTFLRADEFLWKSRFPTPGLMVCDSFFNRVRDCRGLSGSIIRSPGVLPDSSRDALDNFAQVRLAEMHLHMEREMHDSQGA